MVRINKEKLGGVMKELETTEPANEESCAESCSCSDPSSCGIDKGCKKQNWQDDT